MPSRSVIAFALSAVAAASAPVRAEVYRDTIHKFSFEIPVGWERLTRGELQRVNAAVKQRWRGQKIRYESGLRPARNVLGQFPFLLVHWIPKSEFGGGTPDEVYKTIVRDLGGEVRVLDGGVGDLAVKLDAGTAAADAKRNRFVLRLQREFDRDTIDCVGVGHVGENGVALLLFYAREGEARSVALLAEWVSESVQFTDDEPPPAAAPTSGFGAAVAAAKERAGGDLNFAALVGVGVAGVVGLVGWVASAAGGRRAAPPPAEGEWR